MDSAGITVLQNNTIGKKRIILAAAAVFILGLALGISGFLMLKQKEEQQLPVNLSTLKNPVFNQWIGGVEGTLLAKTDKAFTLSRNGGKLTINLHDNLTGFIEASPSGKTSTLTQYTLDQIPLGSYLRGAVTILPKNTGGFSGVPGEQITANAFTIVKMPEKLSK